MDLLNDNVVLLVENETRADLYRLWLETFTVRTALTTRQASEIFDQRVVVTVIDEDFGDGNAPKLLEVLRRRNPICEFVSTQDREVVFPRLNVDNRLVKPVFKDELREMVGGLACRVNYRVALQKFYAINTQLASIEVGEGEAEERRDRSADLEKRAEQLRTRLLEYRRVLDPDDIAAIIHSITYEPDLEEVGSTEKIHSKYRPTKCSHCRREWGATARTDPTMGFERLGAYVWRCTNCGHVQMHADPAHQRVGDYRR